MTLAIESTGFAEVEAALGALGARTVRVKPGQWLIEGSIVMTAAHEAEDWVALEAQPRGEGEAQSAWRLLELNRGLPQPAKLVLGAGARERVRADLSLGEANGALTERIRAACEAVRCGCRSLRSGASAEPDGGAPAGDANRAGDAATDAEDLAARCREAGWPSETRDGGSAAVTLDVDDVFVQAHVRRCGGRIHVSAELLAEQVPAAPCKEAIGLFLLAVARAVRTVRPSAETRADQVSVRLDVGLGADPSTAMLDRALSCLSLAAALCAREVQALTEARLANTYLASQGRLSSTVSQNPSAESQAGARDTDSKEEAQ